MPDSHIGLLMVAVRGESRFMGTSMKFLNSIQGEVRSPRSRNTEGGRGAEVVPGPRCRSLVLVRRC